MHHHLLRGRFSQGGHRVGLEQGGPQHHWRVSRQGQVHERARRGGQAHCGKHGNRGNQAHPGTGERARLHGGRRGQAAAIRQGAVHDGPGFGRVAHQGTRHQPVSERVAHPDAHPRVHRVHEHADSEGAQGKPGARVLQRGRV